MHCRITDPKSAAVSHYGPDEFHGPFSSVEIKEGHSDISIHITGTDHRKRAEAIAAAFNAPAVDLRPVVLEDFEGAAE